MWVISDVRKECVTAHLCLAEIEFVKKDTPDPLLAASAFIFAQESDLWENEKNICLFI